LINGFAGQFSLGHAGFMAIGAYTSSIITATLHLQPGSPISHLIITGALLAGGLMASLFGLLVGIPSLRLKGDYLAITTLGFGEIIRVLIQNMDFLGAARGFSGVPKLANFFWVYAVAAILIFFLYNLINSTYGKGFLAVRDDEIAAEATGISATRLKVWHLSPAPFLPNRGRPLRAFRDLYQPITVRVLRSFEIVVMVVVGGMGSIPGVILAAILLTVLPEALRAIAQYRMVIYALLLIIIMLVRPQGLFGAGINIKRYFKKSTEPV
jgi:branched-chain amino acid transport system permease protein